MQDNIPLNKTVVNQDQFKRVVNTNFTTFVNTNFDKKELTVDEFFSEYERLFFDIPELGENNSHQYLSKKSGEYINFEKDTQDIQPLLDEIASLREQLLQVNTELIQAQTANIL
jgi:hypothetical protein